MAYNALYGGAWDFCSWQPLLVKPRLPCHIARCAHRWSYQEALRSASVRKPFWASLPQNCHLLWRQWGEKGGLYSPVDEPGRWAGDSARWQTSGNGWWCLRAPSQGRCSGPCEENYKTRKKFPERFLLHWVTLTSCPIKLSHAAHSWPCCRAQCQLLFWEGFLHTYAEHSKTHPHLQSCLAQHPATRGARQPEESAAEQQHARHCLQGDRRLRAHPAGSSEQIDQETSE